jgi:hypothetical protein
LASNEVGCFAELGYTIEKITHTDYMSPKKKASKRPKASDPDFTESELDELWSEANEFGTWVRKTDYPDVTSDELLETGLIEDENRIKQLEDGAKPSRTEVQEYLEWWLES